MVIQDHYGLVTLAGHHPLRGANNDLMGPRFPSMSDAYDERLQQIVAESAAKLGLADRVRLDGTYAYACGPCYESMGEVRFLKSIGCDSVGASTVPEVIAAKHCGMQVLGLSLITNAAVTHKSDPVANHEDVLAAVEACAVHVEAILRNILKKAVLGVYLATLPSHEPRIPNISSSLKSSVSPPLASTAAVDLAAEDDFSNAIVSVVALGAIVAGLFLVLKRK
jgi:purine-nucleoside phosphorylase